MTTVLKLATQKALTGYLTVKNITMNDLAVKLGVGSEVIWNIEHGLFSSISEKILMRVWNHVNPEKMTGLIQTKDSESVFAACRDAVTNKRMIGLTGDTGCGKTTALKAFSLKMNVFYYYIDATVTPTIFLKGMLREMGVSFDGTPNDLLHRLADEFNSLENPLLIIDECGKLKDRMILLLHSLRDLTLHNCGIVLAGMPAFKNGLIAKVNKGVVGYSEFYRRVNIWHHLDGLTAEEIGFVLDANGITGKEDQREFRKLVRFGDLMNEIELYKTVNN